jgi:uncharacterized integral membrane protein (TIGR00698 family)
MFSAFSPRRILPGLVLSAAIAAAALAGEYLEVTFLGGHFIESLILAIALGAVVTTLRRPAPALRPGIDFSAKFLLEIAIVLIGASISLETIGGAGLPQLIGIAALVVLSIGASYLVGRAFGLGGRLALLIACGNSICGNSAIVAVAPVIEAPSEDVAAALAFTAVLGVFAVFLLPVVYAATGLSPVQYGMFAGLTVYAVPQVLAAAAPAGAIAIQTGALVKLVRVMMLGPVIFAIGLGRKQAAGSNGRRPALVPWFILGFIAMLLARSFGLVPNALLAPMAMVASALTVVAMAALGLSVDIRAVAHAGGRVIATAITSLALLGLFGWGLIALLGIA